MPRAFSTFASSRFVEQDVVVGELRALARRLKRSCDEVESVYLFGSFATGRATPRSDADVAVVVSGGSAASRERVRRAAAEGFLEAPVPVDLHLLGPQALWPSTGIAGALRRDGLRLA